MTFGTLVNTGNIRYTRYRDSEPTAGLAKSARSREAPDAAVAAVDVAATLEPSGNYSITVSADGQSTTVHDVRPHELAEKIARLIHVVTKAVRNGDLNKTRDSGMPHYGLNTPRPNRENLRFA